MGSTALVAIALAGGNVAVAKSPPASVPPADQDAVVGYECRTTTSRRTLSGNVARSAEAIELNALLLDADVSLRIPPGGALPVPPNTTRALIEISATDCRGPVDGATTLTVPCDTSIGCEQDDIGEPYGVYSDVRITTCGFNMYSGQTEQVVRYWVRQSNGKWRLMEYSAVIVDSCTIE